MPPSSLLIVDNQAPLRISTYELLQQEGYPLFSAVTGEQGWEQLRERRPDVILINDRLPDMNGRELCRRIRRDSALKKVFIILIADALLCPEDQISGFEAGADSILHRPIPAGVLLAHIEALWRIQYRQNAQEGKDRELNDARMLARSIMDEAATQRQRAEDARRQLEESTQSLRMLSRAVEDSPVGVVITDRQGRIEYINPHFTRTTGYSHAEVIGQDTRFRKSGQHPLEFYTELWETLIAGCTWRGEICNRKKNGDLHWESAAISPIRNPTHEITHFVAIYEDISRRKQLDAELHQAKDAADAANRAKSAFLANMSHEIRTPMNAILGYSQLLQRDANLTASAAESLHIINRSGEHLLNLINDVLEMSKIEAGRMSLATAAFNLSALLADLSSMFRLRTEAKGLTFEIVYQGEMPPCIVADERKLRQVLVNLLGNAIKFTERGAIALRVTTRQEPSGQFHLAMEVEDTGVGIATNELGKLFSFFEQTASGRNQQTGTGLGLAISREYIRLMGGDLTVTSQWNKGSIFRFEIPIETAAAESIPEKPALLRRVIGLKAGQRPLRILVVDSAAASRTWLTKLLTTVGFEVQEATEGRGAIRKWQQWNPHIILMGLSMPGMNGCDATRAIRSLPGGKDPSIFAVTASVFDENREAALNAGVDAFLPKPLKESELFEKIQETLHIEYLYACIEADGKSKAVTPAAPDATPKPLKELPDNLLELMRQAIHNGDMEKLRLLIRKTAKYDEPFAQLLGSLADQYEFDDMFQLLAGDSHQT